MKNQTMSLLDEPDTALMADPALPVQRILVVDDDSMICQLNSDVLSSHGYVVDVAEDGADAWEALQFNTYDLMITDNSMPNLSGVDLLKKIYAVRLPLPVIMATSTVPTWELANHPWLRPAAIMLKPYTIDELMETVKSLLSPSSAADGMIMPPPKGRTQPPNDDLRA
jgi:DNA-binding response OmpR family regulator